MKLLVGVTSFVMDKRLIILLCGKYAINPEEDSDRTNEKYRNK